MPKLDRAALIGRILVCAKRAGIEPNDMIRFIVDYDNGVDPIEPCATVMSFCEYFLALSEESQGVRVPREPTEEWIDNAQANHWPMNGRGEIASTIAAVIAAAPVAREGVMPEVGKLGEPFGITGCGDHSCFIAKPSGMGTNGGCRCSPSKFLRIIRHLSAAPVAREGWIDKDKVEWVVNDNAELGVKIGDQFFWLYKGYSLVYESGLHDNGEPMHWRHVFKREFGECCHPINHQDYTKFGTVSLDDSAEWKPLPAAPAGSGEGK